MLARIHLLHADVAIFWQTLRLLYCYTGMAPLRHDLFLCLGFWHPFMYGHIALWSEFRHTFLGPAFFHLFSKQKLLRRPKLTHSSTFFSWLRLCYPSFRHELSKAMESVRQSLLKFELAHIRAIKRRTSRWPQKQSIPWSFHSPIELTDSF